MKKTTPPKPPRPGGNPGGLTKFKISPSVTVLAKQLEGFTTLSGAPRKSLTPAQLKEAQALADKIKAMEAKAAADKKKNAKIIKKQDKKPLVTGRGKTKPITTTNTTGPKKPVIKITGRAGLRGGGMIGGGGGMSRVNR